MATKPKTTNLNATSVQVLNVIRSNASTNYQQMVDEASDLDSVRAIGNVLANYPALQNEFVEALVNRIALVLIRSKLYENPWAVFKKGVIDLGETVEEVFVNLCDPENYDVDKAEREVFKRVQSDVRSAFHVLNYKKLYKKTINKQQLKQAFLSLDGVTDLISKMIESMSTSANYDEFLVMKYLLAVTMLNGSLPVVKILDTTEENMTKNVATIKAVSNNLTFMSTDKNMAGVTTHTPIEDQYIILNADFDAIMDVSVLASAFNMDKAEFLGHRMLVDSFAQLDVPRLDKLLGDNAGYHRFTDEELSTLKDVQCVIIDKDFFMVYDNLIEFTDINNPQGLYWNYFLHNWKTLSVSPFVQTTVFTKGSPSVTSVSISPKTASAKVGESLQFTATVEASGLGNKSVMWSADGQGTISSSGYLTIDNSATGTITVRATSVANPEKTDTATVTITE